jgi:hypothetical protein
MASFFTRFMYTNSLTPLERHPRTGQVEIGTGSAGAGLGNGFLAAGEGSKVSSHENRGGAHLRGINTERCAMQIRRSCEYIDVQAMIHSNCFCRCRAPEPRVWKG